MFPEISNEEESLTNSHDITHEIRNVILFNNTLKISESHSLNNTSKASC